MRDYVGFSAVRATAMTLGEYNELRGWQLPADEDGSTKGQLIEHPNEEPNMDGFEGFVTWTPLAQFNRIYRPLLGLTFGEGLEALKSGYRVSRKGWNGKGMWLKLIPADAINCFSFHGQFMDALPWIGMKTADDCFVPWLASQTDMLAEDWEVVDDPMDPDNDGNGEDEVENDRANEL